MLVDVTGAMLEFVSTYGYVAFLVFIVLETAWILHFAPSEVVIPLAAAHLVTSPGEFVLFVGVGTVGATMGSLLAYQAFGVYGDRVLRKYGDYLHLPESEIERSQAWFRRWGEGLLFWGRLVPILRTPISIPAGYAGTDLRRFTVYSAGGWLVYNTALVWVVYDGGDERAPADVALALARRTATENPALAALVALAGVAAVAWYVASRRGATDQE